MHSTKKSNFLNTDDTLNTIRLEIASIIDSVSIDSSLAKETPFLAQTNKWERELGNRLLREGAANIDVTTRAFETVVTQPRLTDPDASKRIGFDGNPLGVDDDEFISPECIDRAIAAGIDRVGIKEAQENIRQWAAEVNSGKLNGMVFWDMVFTVEGFSAELMRDLLSCYAASEAKQTKFLILFDLDEFYFEPHTNGGYDNQVVLERAIFYIKSNDRKRILVVGRTSRIGNQYYNRDLSSKRAHTVYRKLVDAGISSIRIIQRWFGQEPLQLTEEVAGTYGLLEEYNRYGELGINQSVLIVVY